MDKYQPYVPTVGCKIHVLVLPPSASRSEELFVELWDVGGNPRFATSRSIFYAGCDGFMFVWDSSSEATYHALDQWLNEVIRSRQRRTAAVAPASTTSANSTAGTSITSSSSSSSSAAAIATATAAVGGGNETDLRAPSGQTASAFAFAGGIMSDMEPMGQLQRRQGGLHTFHFSPLRPRARTASSSLATTSASASASVTSAAAAAADASQSRKALPGPIPIPPSLPAFLDEEAQLGNSVVEDNTSTMSLPLDIPLVIVGNKADKLAPQEFGELRDTCSAHIFLSTRSTDPSLTNTQPVLDFFEKAWERRRESMLGVGSSQEAEPNNPGRTRLRGRPTFLSSSGSRTFVV